MSKVEKTKLDESILETLSLNEKCEDLKKWISIVYARSLFDQAKTLIKPASYSANHLFYWPPKFG